jgi:hypothetical protein
MTDIDDITTRNRIMAESQLPLLDVAQELARIERVRKQKSLGSMACGKPRRI